MTQQQLEWKFTHPISGLQYELGKQGSVQETLIREKVLPDPFYGENEQLFTWIEEHEWVMTSQVILTKEQLNHDYLELDFASIDTYAKIYVNGHLAAETANAFHPHRIQIKKYAQAGLNEVKVVFTSPVNYHQKAYKARHSQLPAPNDVGKIAIANYSRKPQYQFGWDWALRMNTIGFWRPATVRTFNNNRILQAKIETLSFEPNKAKLNLQVYLDQQIEGEYNIESQLFGLISNFKVEGSTLNTKLELASPQLWWPRGQGKQTRYTDTIKLLDKENKLIDQYVLNFGIKTVELIQEKDHWGTSFYLKVNNRPIFCKGANYIPQDVFPARVKDEHTRKMVAEMAASNFNMVRVWGGGYYPEEAFFEACDELGIMVWQDLMFACAMYPGNESFMDLVKTELNEVIPRISSHVSVCYINGNNEVDVAWKNWGFQIRYLIAPRTQREIERDYKALFQDLAPKTIAKHTQIPYEHTSPLSNWGKDEYFDHGTMHYWGVWHGKDPMEDFGLKTGRFNAEYGFQSFPEYYTLRQFSTENQWSLEHPVMKHHQKSYVGNGMIKKHADILYGEAKNFKEFVYFSQLTQAKAVGTAVSGHRADAPRCMGTLYWQFNDCWPAPTWSSIDYYDNWKALQYQVKKDYEDITIIEKAEKTGPSRYYFVSDYPEPFSTEITYTAWKTDGKELFSGTEQLNSDGFTLQEICRSCHEENIGKENFLLEVRWKKTDGSLGIRQFYHEPKVLIKTPGDEVILETYAIDPKSKTGVLKLTNKGFLASCWIFANLTGVRFEENFEHYLPGEHLINFSFEKAPVTGDFDLIWR